MEENKWSIHIPCTTFVESGTEKDVYELPITIYLDLPLGRSPLSVEPTKPIQIRRIRLWDEANKETLCDYSVRTNDSSVSVIDGNRALITYRFTLHFRHLVRKRESDNEFADNLSIEIYDNTVSACALQFKASQIVGTGTRGIKVTSN